MEVLTEEGLAERYQSLDAMGILLGWDAETNTNRKRVSNEYIARLVKKYPRTFIGFAGVDPWKGKVAIEEAEIAIKDLGLRGVKFQQAAQGFYPSDKRFLPSLGKNRRAESPRALPHGQHGIRSRCSGRETASA